MDSKSKVVDIDAILQVLGSIYKKPSLLAQEDKYKIIPSDFTKDFHRVIFGSIQRLYELGAPSVTINDIETFLKKREKDYAVYEANNGNEFLQKIADTAEPDNFDYYFSRMKKFSLLRAYNELVGVDTSFIYDSENIFDVKKRKLQDDELDSCSIEQLMEKVELKVNQVVERFSENVYSRNQRAGEGLRDLVNKLQKVPDIGVPLYGNLVNTFTRGARLKKFYLRSAPSGYGKAIPNYTLLPTPEGLRRADQIKVGDYLFDRHGKPTEVLAIYPQEKPKEVYEMQFADTATAESCSEHLWYVTKTGGKDPHVMTTEELMESLDRKESWYLPGNEAVEYNINLSPVFLHPYVMGLYLGDGVREHFIEDEVQLKPLIERLTGMECRLGALSNKGFSFWEEKYLKQFPELWGATNERKFIPREYLFGSLEDRMWLLQGILDAGSVVRYDQVAKGEEDLSEKIVGSSTRFKKCYGEKFTEQVRFLARSLGYKASISLLESNGKRVRGMCRVYASTPERLKDFFVLDRIKDRIDRSLAINPIDRITHNEYKIKAIVPTGRTVGMVCFKVGNEEHLFLMNDFFVTHNSRTMIADMCNIACDRIYDSAFGWIKNGSKEPCLYISTELEIDEVQTMMLAFLSNVPEDHIIGGRYGPHELERVLEATKILEESSLYIEIVPDFTLKDIENIIKRNVRENGVKYVGYDYLHSSISILGEITRAAGGVKLREDNILFMLAAKLKDLCNQYDIFIISSTQLNGDWKTSETPDMNLLRGSKSVADRIDIGYHLLPVTQSDLDSLADILGATGFKPPILKYCFYKSRRSRYKNCILWCDADMSVCRVNPMFATTYNYEILDVKDLKITIENEEEGAF